MGQSDEEVLCALVWKLARSHGWSSEVDVASLVSSANVLDESRGRDLARNELPAEPFVGYHRGRDTIWLVPPPGDELRVYLRDGCGYGQLQIDATFSSYKGRG